MTIPRVVFFLTSLAFCHGVAQVTAQADLAREIEALVTAGKQSEAIALLSERVKSSPSEANLRVYLAKVYASASDWPNARASSVAALKLNPKSGAVHVILSGAALAENNGAEAIREARTALDMGLTPTDRFDAYVVLGHALAAEKRYDDAAAAYQAGLASAEESGQKSTGALPSELARTLMRAGRPTAAVEVIDKVLATDSSATSFLGLSVVALEQSGQTERAAKRQKEWEAAEPNPKVRAIMREVFQRDAPEAIQAARATGQSTVSSSTAANARTPAASASTPAASASAGSGRSVQPLETPAQRTTPPSQQQSATNSNSGDLRQAEFHFKVALVALKNNDLTVAAEELKEASRLAPNNALVWYNLGLVDSKRNSAKTAVEHIRRAIALGLPPTEAAAAEELLVAATYEMKKTGADVPELMYGLSIGLSPEQVAARGIRFGTRQASEFGARHHLSSTPPGAFGDENQISIYFGEGGLHRIWANWTIEGKGYASAPRARATMFKIVDVLKARGFVEFRRENHKYYVYDDDRVPLRIELRRDRVRAFVIAIQDFYKRGIGDSVEPSIVYANEVRLVLEDPVLCPACDK